MRLAIVRPLFGVMSMLMTVSIAYAAGRATVRGAEAVNVRRAPSPDSAAIATLARGSSVKVQRVEDGWALVTLESGREGYVKAAFLELPAGIQVIALQPTAPAAVPTPSPAELGAEPAVSPAPAATPAARAEGEREGLERQVAQLRDRLAALESAIVSSPGSATPAARSDTGESAGKDLVASGDVPGHEAGGALLPTVTRSPDSQELGPSLALAGIGVILGLIIGAAYGRRQERNRRSRVRF
jgi:SH3 domain-containing protein